MAVVVLSVVEESDEDLSVVGEAFVVLSVVEESVVDFSVVERPL